MKIKDGNNMKSSIHILKIFTIIILFLQIIGQQKSLAQEQDTIAIIPPFLDKYQRDDWSGMIELDRQETIILLYQNAAAVYMEADFNNKSSNSIRAEISLPSTGYTINDVDGKEWNSKGILGVKLWVDGESVTPEIQPYGDDIWYSILPIFKTDQKTNIKALFWLPTTYGAFDESGSTDTSFIEKGKRCMMVCFSKAAMWNDDINSAKFTVILKDGLIPTDSLLEILPESYEQTDSSFNWELQNIEPTTENDIVIRYDTNGNTITPLNTLTKNYDYILKYGYEELLEYVRNE
jgi:hypothetical protein